MPRVSNKPEQYQTLLSLPNPTTKSEVKTLLKEVDRVCDEIASEVKAAKKVITDYESFVPQFEAKSEALMQAYGSAK